MYAWVHLPTHIGMVADVKAIGWKDENAWTGILFVIVL